MSILVNSSVDMKKRVGRVWVFDCIKITCLQNAGNTQTFAKSDPFSLM